MFEMKLFQKEEFNADAMKLEKICNTLIFILYWMYTDAQYRLLSHLSL